MHPIPIHSEPGSLVIRDPEHFPEGFSSWRATLWAEGKAYYIRISSSQSAPPTLASLRQLHDRAPHLFSTIQA